MKTWRTRFNFVLVCIATAALTSVICAETVMAWRLAVAGVIAVAIGLYAGLWLPKEKGTESSNNLGVLEGIVELQGQDGTWNFNAYSFGMANGLLLALAVMKGEEPIFLDAPERWLEDGGDLVSESMPFEDFEVQP